MRKVDVRERRRLLDDTFKVEEAHVSFERNDGSMTPPIRQLVFERGDSIACVVLHRDSQKLLFTEQFRFATCGKAGGWLTEIMAGRMEEGESPETTLWRELEEELGYRPDLVERVATFFTSPGGSSERVFVFYVEVSDGGKVGSGGGLVQENEEIRIVPLSLDAARAALRDGRFNDAKTLVGMFWLLARDA
jgi:ADP-ribose pyrophosphatase